MFQVFVGLKSGILDGNPMKSETQVPDAFEDVIQRTCTPLGLMSDQAKSEMHRRMKDLLRMYEIGDAQSEADYQNQNPTERKIQTIKKTVNGTMDRTGCPPKCWLLCLLFVIGLFNHLPNSDGNIPLTVVTGQIPDISKYLHYHFWQEVFVSVPGKPHQEQLARWCYPVKNVGDKLTYWVLLEEMQQLIARSNVQPTKDPLFLNLRKRPNVDNLRQMLNRPLELSPPVVEEAFEDMAYHGEFEESPFVTASSGEKKGLYNLQDHYGDKPVHLPCFSPEKLLGLMFLYELEDGQKVCVKISKKIQERDAENHQNIKMLLSFDDDRIEELISYNELCDIVAEQHDAEVNGEQDIFTFREILDHRYVKPHDHDYKGSSINVLVAWEDGTETWEPLTLVAKSDPVTLAVYAKEHDLLDQPGWKHFWKIARCAKVLK
jgi:hypothetical protein